MMPSRRSAFVFAAKVLALQLKRAGRELARRPARGRKTRALADAPVVAQSVTALWTAQSAAELRLTAGKVENLRVAVRAFDGIELGPGEVFSFWRQLGRPTRRRGYVEGRELREGCIVPSVAGGLCQLSNALYDAALKAGLTVVERHAHSRVVPGSLAEQGRDATVFWNYVDLRFASPRGLRIEAELTGGDLVVTLRAPRAEAAAKSERALGKLKIEAASCETCGVNQCFRHHELHADGGKDAVSLTAALVDGVWPEHAAWLAGLPGPAARQVLLAPLDGERRGKPQYAWPRAPFGKIGEAAWVALKRSFVSRRLAAQGAARQKALLALDRELARALARQLDPCVTHLIVAQSLLVPLLELGALGGRTYEVLMTRPPLSKLQAALDRAAAAQPASATLADFRVAPEVVAAESKALARAKAIVTPSAQIAAMFPDRAKRLEWVVPRGEAGRAAEPGVVLFAGPTAGRKGAYELRDAARQLGLKLLIAGRTLEAPDVWQGLEHEVVAFATGLRRAAVLAAPAHVEAAPRAALQALALGVPVIASEALGLGERPGVTTLRAVTANDLALALQAYTSCSFKNSSTAP
jgi:hypothetical protein